MNMAFIIALTLFCAGAVAFVLYPLLWDAGAAARRRTRREVNSAIFQDRLAELKYDVAHGTLTREQYDEAVADLEAELVQSGAIEPERGAPAPPSRQRPLLIASGALAVLGVPLLAVALYANVGFAELVALDRTPMPQQVRGSTPPRGDAGGMQAAPHDDAAFEELVGQLRERLAASPDDRRGWVLLARTLVFLERFEEASAAYRRAADLGGDSDPDLLVQYADVLAQVRGGLSGEPTELLEKALVIEPTHPQGLWLAGSAAYYEADYASARRYWERLLAVLPPDSEVASVIRSNLDDVAARSGGG